MGALQVNGQIQSYATDSNESINGVQFNTNKLYLFNNSTLSGLWESDRGYIIKIEKEGNIAFYGNAATANKWYTARTIKIGDAAKSVDGSSDLTWTHNQMGVPYGSFTTPSGTPCYAHWGMLIHAGPNKYGVSGTSDNYFLGVNSSNQLHIGHQLNGASTITWTNILSEHNYSSYALPLSGGTITGSLSVNGALRIGSSNSNYLAFYGTVGDGPGSYTHAYIGERLYGGSESSELLLFKGNDIPGAPGPDRIRHIAAQHLFQVYTTAFGVSETFENVGTSSLPITKLEINSNGIVVNGSCSASSFISSGDFTAPTYIATQRMVVSATGLVNLTAAGTTRLYADGLAISNPGTQNDDAWIRVTGTGELDTILEIATGDDGGGLADTGPESIVVRQYGSNGIAHQFTLLNTNGDAFTTGSIRSNHLYLTPNTYLHMSYNSTDFPVIFNHGNGNVSINACGAGLYLGYSSTTAIYTRGTYTNIDSGNYSSYALPLSGGTMSGPLNFANGTWNFLGDDVYFGDYNVAGAFCIKGANGNTNLRLYGYADSSTYAQMLFTGSTIEFNHLVKMPWICVTSYGPSLPAGSYYGQIYYQI